MFFEDMINSLIEKKKDAVNIVIETLLLISYLTNQNEMMKTVLENNSNFMKIIQSLILHYSVS